MRRKPTLTVLAAVLASTCSGPQAPGTATTAPNSPTQDGTPPPLAQCAYTLSSDVSVFAREGSSGTLKITTGPSCAWTLSEDVSWIGIDAPLQGTGPATRRISAAASTDASERRATIKLADQSLSFSQPGQDSCQYQVSPVTAGFPRVPSTGTVSIATTPACLWTASSDSAWLHIAAAGGSGSGSVSYTLDSNPQGGYGEQRQGVIPIRWVAPTAGQNVHVSQQGSCNLAVSPATPTSGYSGGRMGTLTVGADGGTYHFFALSDPFMSCVWIARATDAWVTINFGDASGVLRGNGDADLHFTVAPNPSGQTRTTTIDMDGEPLTIVQSGRGQ